ncbi:hypothetical protein IV38_GL001903 [Lactobacillus selangorensis]|uniref:Accessory secretory protein Asp1 n=1 Tax=Lactobacillus selangorensis TaxID=81857 RepID=A0A0R2FP68_9LACO|nr:hypothetical protein IV38_GL001903 [Lactobacillus selangorensis]KRN30345.1 hypothetical protein IV40_GL001934 [Lactobacillus selangorensis]
MYSLIPDWSDQANLLTDPLANVARLFQQSELPFRILLLKPRHDWRTYLNQNGLLNMQTWNALDAALGIHLTAGKGLAIADLPLPSNAEFVYDVYQLRIYQNNNLYSTVHFNDDGFVTDIYYERQENGLVRHDRYDERGFKISESAEDEQGQMVRQKWFNEYGDCILVETPQKVTVQPLAQKRFLRSDYASLELLLREVVERQLSIWKAGDKQFMLLSTMSASLKVIMERLQTVAPTLYLVATQLTENQA